MFGTTGEKPPKEVALKMVNTDQLTQEVYTLIAALRANPSSFADKMLLVIEQNTYKSDNPKVTNRLCFPEGVCIKMTNSFLLDLQETIAVLKQTPKLGPLEKDAALIRAAQCLGKDRFTRSHYGTDGSTPGERAREAGYLKTVNECMMDIRASAMGIVTTFLIDHKVKNRGHRKNLLHPETVKIGVSCVYHPFDVTDEFIRCVIVGGY